MALTTRVMKAYFSRILLVLATACSTTSATTRYVDLHCPTPTPPYTNWSTAATTIQDAVDAAKGADLILVTNGVYASGGRSVLGMSNRVAVIGAGIILQSVNGPEQTIIQGCQVPGTTNGPGAVRCAYLDGKMVLSGFTLTNGATLASGDEYNLESGGGIRARSELVVVTNCVITGNSAAWYGGGVYGYGTLNNCLLIGNSAYIGGGAGATTSGGIWLVNSRVQANSAGLGGGLYNADAHASVLTDNSADQGGGASGGQLVQCTVTRNRARIGAGTASSMLGNSIVYFNYGVNYYSSTFRYCCTSPLPAGGAGNISVDPQLVSTWRLSASSPCRGVGYNSYAILTDMDGEAWRLPPAIGCDEYNAGAITGALSVAISAASTNVATGYAVDFATVIQGRPSASVWRFGDGTSVSNRPYPQHAWAVPGDYVVTLTAFNEDHPEGTAASLTMHVQTTPTHFVMLGSTNPVAPYERWETAAGDIQSAVDAANVPGAMVIVGDGVYDTGGRAVDGLMTNRVAVTKPLVLRSVSGPAATSIVGYQVPGSTNGDGAIRCVYLGESAILSGFTLTNGATRTSGVVELEQKGGAVWCPSIYALVTNCVLTRNTAYQRGGGIYEGTLDHCTLSDNSAKWGGGAYASLLTECVLTGNSAGPLGAGGGVAFGVLNNCTLVGNLGGGGAAESWLNNCIAYFNSGNYSAGTLNFCCTTPLPTSGVGNFTNAPLLADVAARNFHLQTNSPCINGGANSYVDTDIDLEGNPRIAGGTVDIGAYEFEKPLSVISYAWLQSYGLPTDGTADALDSDSDCMNTWQEWIAGTNPTNSTSALRLLSPVANLPAVTLTWQSVTNRTYCLQRAFDLTGPGGFMSIASNIPGGLSTTSFTNADAFGPSPALYRVLVQRP